MAIITLAQAAQYAQNAGFQGNALATILAITLRESGQRDALGNYNGLIDTQATNKDSGAAGVLQFNPSPAAFGPGILNIAYSPQSAYDFAFQVTKGGNDFGPWKCGPEDCGLPAGQYITPTSPGSVIGSNGQPIGLPPDFGAVTGFYGQNTGIPGGSSALEPLNVTINPGQAASSAAGSILGAPIDFLQNAGVGVLGLVVLLIGGLIIAAPMINENVVQPAVKNAKAAALA